VPNDDATLGEGGERERDSPMTPGEARSPDDGESPRVDATGLSRDISPDMYR
jgi:hypothetical protein